MDFTSANLNIEGGIYRMEWQIIIAILIAIPIILFPIALIWYLNLGGIMTAVKEAKIKRALKEKEGEI